MTGRNERAFTMSLTRMVATRLLSMILFTLLLTSCLGRSPDVRHFVLGASSRSVEVEQAVKVGVLVGPVRLPAYLERSQIAMLEDDGEVVLDEFNRWLGGFEENFVRAISLSLGRELGSDAVVAAPSKAPFPFDYQVRLHVDDMILDDAGELRVRIRWALLPERSETAPGLFVMDESFPSDGRSVVDIVRVHDAALLALVHRIAEEIARSESTR